LVANASVGSVSKKEDVVTEETVRRDYDYDNNDDNENGGVKGRQLSLSQMIDAVGDELREAAEKAQADPVKPIMRFKQCQIEMGVTVEKKGEAGVNIWVFTLGGSATKTNTNTVTVTFDALADGFAEFAAARALRHYIEVETDRDSESSR
jgi:hypothetical protein